MARQIISKNLNRTPSQPKLDALRLTSHFDGLQVLCIVAVMLTAQVLCVCIGWLISNYFIYMFRVNFHCSSLDLIHTFLLIIKLCPTRVLELCISVFMSSFYFTPLSWKCIIVLWLTQRDSGTHRSQDLCITCITEQLDCCT